MNGKIVFALVLVAIAASVECTKPTPKFAPVKKSPTSSDVEALLDPTVHSLPKGQHKLVFKGASGQEQCVVCQPFQGCGCRDVVAIRCELKRLKQKLLRLKRIAHPHKRSHHDRKTNKPKVKVAVKPAVRPLSKKLNQRKQATKPKKVVKPKVKVVVKPKKVVKPKVKVAVKPAPKPTGVPAPKIVVKEKKVVKPQVKVAVKPAPKPVAAPVVAAPAPKPATQPLVKVAVAAPVKAAEKKDQKPLIKVAAPVVKAAVVA